MSLTKRALGISPSLTLAITAKAKKMKEDGISVIGFGAGEPDFNTPDYIVNAAKAALDKGMTKYTASSGIIELKKAICQKFEKDNNLKYNPNQIVISNGAKHSLYNAMQAIVEKGDEVIIPSPYWLTYPELVHLCDGKCKFVKGSVKNNYKMTAAQLKSAIGKKTKALILNSPSNPTGAVYTKHEIEEIAKVALEHNIWVISDEIYEKLIYDNQKHYSIAQHSEKMKNKTIIINGVSKTYAMTGWRIGYLAAPKEVADAIDGIQSHETSNACSVSQYAALAALTGGEEFVNKMLGVFDERRNYMISALKKIKGVSIIKPQGAFYVMVNIKKLKGRTYDGAKIKSSLIFTDKLLSKGVAVVPGDAFGSDDFVRLSYAMSLEDIKEGIKRLADFVEEVMM